MNAIEQFKKGEITEKELVECMKNNPEIRTEAEALLSGQMDEEELEKIAAAGEFHLVNETMAW